jgi:Flp pilus assembly protein TadD
MIASSPPRRGELETQALLRLAHVKPDYPMLHVLIAGAMMSMAEVDYPGVLAELAHAEKRNPGDAGIFYLRGKVYVAMNRNQDAVDALRRAIELGPMDPSPYYQLGLTYQKLGQTELAREMLDRMQHLKQSSKP